MKIWIVSMECAGISEAGGVKNVTLSLCKELSLLKHDVTLFIPLFKCSNMQFIKDVKEEEYEGEDMGGYSHNSSCFHRYHLLYKLYVSYQ